MSRRCHYVQHGRRRTQRVVLAVNVGPHRESGELGSWQFDPALAELREALAEVARLGNLRTDYVYRSGSRQLANVPMSNVYERHSRTAILADNNAAQLLECAAARYRHMDAGYWLSVIATPGVTLCWQNTTQQFAQPAPANITRERARMADQAKAREDAFKARHPARRIA